MRDDARRWRPRCWRRGRELAHIAPDFVGIMHDQPGQVEIRVIDDELQ